ncbi:MAG TPA: response regulator transcription factor [Polyangiales bacterium]
MKLLVAEDDRKLAQFLQRVLVEEGYVVDLCSTGTAALEQAGSGLYALMVLDWMLPGLDGLEVCRRLRMQGHTLPILMLTARDAVQERVLGLNAGADDYLGKPFEVQELLARLSALLRRASGHAHVSVGALTIDQTQRRVQVDGREIELTQREFALLLHLLHRRGHVVSRSELLSAVWSTGFDTESNVVEVHMSRLRNKLGAHADMIDTVRGRGYRLRTGSST